jgi:nitroreductase
VNDAAPDLLHARYRDPSMGATGQLNPVLATMLSHATVRAFLPTPIAPEVLDLVIAAASSAPTSSNLQAWSVMTVRDAGRKARLAAVAGGQKHITQAPVLLVWLADLARLDAIARQSGTEVEGIHYLELFMVAIIDAALAAQNAVVALESLGLGSVYIGALRNDPETVARELGLPKLVFPVFGLCIGTPDPKGLSAPKPRLPQSVVVHQEQYDPALSVAEVAAYDARMSAFQTEQAMPAEVWTQRAIARVKSAKSLNGRHRMREALRALGFELR